MKLISDGTWFKAGTEVTCIDDYRLESGNFNSGLFQGVRISHHECELSQCDKIGDEYLDQEVCGWDEFTIVEE